MKKLLLSLAFLLPFFAFSQTCPTTTGNSIIIKSNYTVGSSIANESNVPAYNMHLSTNRSDWQPFITAIQEAIFEITYTAAIELFKKNGSIGRQKVFLTGVGCGVFCNPHTWSKTAITAMNDKFKDYPLDVYYVDFELKKNFEQ